MTRTILVSNGVGEPIGVQPTPMRWKRVSDVLLQDFCEHPEQWGGFYTSAQIAAAKRELNKRVRGR